ncbi:hypothetical protein AN958_10510 [Leucoagaricus sp. SymC.cos]|nr:hypothetical protein AN958_10510 [Leucoagaricus sp. SymC.cos]
MGSILRNECRIFGGSSNRVLSEIPTDNGRDRDGKIVLQTWELRVGAYEDTKNNTRSVSFKCPGLTKEDIQLEGQDNVLTVSAAPTYTIDGEGGGFVIGGSLSGTISVASWVPPGFEQSHVGFKKKDGVLTVTFPKYLPEDS